MHQSNFDWKLSTALCDPSGLEASPEVILLSFSCTSYGRLQVSVGNFLRNLMFPCHCLVFVCACVYAHEAWLLQVTGRLYKFTTQHFVEIMDFGLVCDW